MKFVLIQGGKAGAVVSPKPIQADKVLTDDEVEVLLLEIIERIERIYHRFFK